MNVSTMKGKQSEGTQDAKGEALGRQGQARLEAAIVAIIEDYRPHLEAMSDDDGK